MRSVAIDQNLRRVVRLVAVLNLAYFGIEFAAARIIGSVSLFADSIDFLEDAAINLLILVASGLDKSKKPPTSLFYLPRQAKNPEDSFFWDFKDGRAALDPTQWIENIYMLPNLSKSQ